MRGERERVKSLRLRATEWRGEQWGLPPGVSTHIWMWDGVLSLNGISLRTREEELIVISLHHRDEHRNKPRCTQSSLDKMKLATQDVI